MKRHFYRGANYLGVLAGVLTAPAGLAQLLISIDMDTSAAGVQSTRSAVPGDIFDAAIIFDLSAQPAGLSSYGVSMQFNNTELQLNGSPAATANPSLPSGLTRFTLTGVGAESNDVGGGLGQVSNFEAGTLGLGPTSGTFSAGTVSFKVLSPITVAGTDITVGLFASGFDGLADNSNVTISSVTFNGGSVVPEPSTYAGVAAGVLVGWAAFRRVSGRHLGPLS